MGNTVLLVHSQHLCCNYVVLSLIPWTRSAECAPTASIELMTPVHCIHLPPHFVLLHVYLAIMESGLELNLTLDLLVRMSGHSYLTFN